MPRASITTCGISSIRRRSGPRFARFPTWMWRNNEVRDFVELAARAQRPVEKGKRVAFHGLDLYSLYNSIRSVLNYLDEVDPESAKVARERYGCLTPWQRDPATYGHAALTGDPIRLAKPTWRARSRDLLAKRRAYAVHDGERFLDAEQNARLVANAERYYRIMYYGSRASWNLRDSHMFDTLKNLLAFHGPDSKAVVWAHNSHVGNAAATEMAARGEHNIGQLCREEFGEQAYLIGFGTDSGTVAAASDWDGPMEIKQVRPAHRRQLRAACATTAGLARFMLRPARPRRSMRRRALGKPRLERAIGVIYRPETERASHYFQASPAGTVRRVHLVRRDPCGYAAGYRRNQGIAGHLSVRGVMQFQAKGLFRNDIASPEQPQYPIGTDRRSGRPDRKRTGRCRARHPGG